METCSLTWLAACSLCDRLLQAPGITNTDLATPSDPDVYQILAGFLDEEAETVVRNVRDGEGCYMYLEGRTGRAPNTEHVRKVCDELRGVATSLRMEIDSI
jgi:hypothetical protein